jgi:two-component system CheB/CheR fusion protein
MRRFRRVLVVDDCRDSADSLALLVGLWGHEAWAAYDGPSALVAAARHRPDVLFLDLALPGLSGFEVARRLRAAGVRPPLLVALTGFGREEDRRASAEAGFDLHLLKPAEPEELMRLLNTQAGDGPPPRGDPPGPARRGVAVLDTLVVKLAGAG